MGMRKELSEELKKIVPVICNSTFLITGATGMIGQNIVEILLNMNDYFDANIHVIAHARSMEKVQTVFDTVKERTDISFHIDDIRELKLEEPIDYIIHTAGVTGGSKQHLEFPMRTITVALEGTKRILDIAVEKRSKGVVYLSSLEVYGNTGIKQNEISEEDFGFIDPTNVRSSYSESKRMCECMCASYTKQYGIPTYIARLTATFGNGVSYIDNRVFAEFARSIIEKKDIVLKSTGETVRNYCDAEDAVIAFLSLFVSGEPGNAYNVSNMETEISIRDLALKFIEVFPESNVKLKFDIVDDVTKLGYNAEMRNVLNSNKLMNIGWKPINSMEDTIRKLVKSMEKDVMMRRK